MSNTIESQQTQQQPVTLAPAGAGLPRCELFILKIGFYLLRTCLTRQCITRWLQSETIKIIHLADTFSPQHSMQPVIIPRPTGLEDNSRGWSIAMTLQHVIIVDVGIMSIIKALSQGQAFDIVVRIEDVKPTQDAGKEQLILLEKTVEDYSNWITTVQSLHTRQRHAHPWFGELNAHGWHTLSALHTMVHRRQLQAIARQLKRTELSVSD